MSIHNFSKENFIDTAKDILQTGQFFGFRKAAVLEADSSFREVLDITSLDIAELIVAIEERYHVNMDWADTNKVDSLNDVYNVFTESLSKTRQSFKQKREQKIAQSTITYEKIKNAAKDSLLNDPELKLNEQDIFPGVKISRRGLGLDDTAKLQLIMDLEKALNIEIDDDKILNKKSSTLDEFCYDIYKQICQNNIQKPEIKQLVNKSDSDITRDDIYKAIEKYIYEKYTIPYVKPTSNWYKDLNLTNFDFNVFREWVEKKYNVRLSYFYFTNIWDICNVIYFDIQTQRAKKALKERMQTMFNKIKNKIK
jgi:acyl carrier protein